MTINVALVTNEAIVLGCDSTASTGDYYIDPFAIGVEKDAEGHIIYDADSKITVKFDWSHLEHITTDAWGGVTKMFALSSTYCKVAAVTSGTASLVNRTISSLGAEFRGRQAKLPATKKPRTVHGVAAEFLKYIRGEYDQHYADSTTPQQFREGPEFLLGGFGQNDKFPCSYRVLVKENEIREEFGKGAGGVSWNAQSDAVERIIRGYDRVLKSYIEGTFDSAIKAYTNDMNTAALRIVDTVLKKLNAAMPDDIDTTLPGPISVKLAWDRFKSVIPYSTLPLQEAVNFVSFLILMQAGKSRFARGVATVGGRTHIGVLTKEEGFRQLNEPVLAHHYTGFADDH